MATMKKRIVLRTIARKEYDEAGDWYEARRRGLGVSFTEAVELVLDQIATQPDFYAIVQDDTREAVVRGFPYCVYYCEEVTQVIVFAVFHTSRDPAVWQSGT
jgi:toxin ParE1/3/4